MSDASFEDGAEQPLSLTAADAEDLRVVSTLLQDAVFPVSEISWSKSRRQFAMLVNRFRWEDVKAADATGRAYERVQTLVVVDDVTSVASQGISKADADMVAELLSLEFEAAEDGAGAIILTLAGDGALRLVVESINITLRDVTKPYTAPSGQKPAHPE
ncbi:MAG: DUF2948 family protein [Mangrovicoccus sp.]